MPRRRGRCPGSRPTLAAVLVAFVPWPRVAPGESREKPDRSRKEGGRKAGGSRTEAGSQRAEASGRKPTGRGSGARPLKEAGPAPCKLSLWADFAPRVVWSEVEVLGFHLIGYSGLSAPEAPPLCKYSQSTRLLLKLHSRKVPSHPWDHPGGETGVEGRGSGKRGAGRSWKGGGGG